MCPHYCWIEGKSNFPQTAGHASRISVWCIVCLTVLSVHCCLSVWHPSWQTYLFSAGLLLSQLLLSCFWSMVFCSRCRSLCFPLLSIIRDLLAQSLRFSRKQPSELKLCSGCIHHPRWFSIVSVFCLIIQVSDENVELYRLQYWLKITWLVWHWVDGQ